MGTSWFSTPRGLPVRSQALMVLIKGTLSCLVCSRVMLSLAELHWSSSCHAVALPLLLRSLAVSREYHLQYLASECILHLAFSQVEDWNQKHMRAH